MDLKFCFTFESAHSELVVVSICCVELESNEMVNDSLFRLLSCRGAYLCERVLQEPVIRNLTVAYSFIWKLHRNRGSGKNLVPNGASNISSFVIG